MAALTIPLSLVHVDWQGHLIPAAFDACQRGIELERNRLAGASYITLAFRREFDFDGLTEYLDLTEGFSELSAAVRFVNDLAMRTLPPALAEPGYGHYTWRHDARRDNERFIAGHESTLVKCSYLRSFRVLTDSGYDSKYFQFEVLTISSPMIVGAPLFSYLMQEQEWVCYFVAKGSESELVGS